eukprot:1827406-Pleurochrysis_carterae.AAC.1
MVVGLTTYLATCALQLDDRLLSDPKMPLLHLGFSVSHFPHAGSLCIFSHIAPAKLELLDLSFYDKRVKAAMALMDSVLQSENRDHLCADEHVSVASCSQYCAAT